MGVDSENTNILISAAKALGGAAGKIASLVKSTAAEPGPEQSEAKARRAKFAGSGKSRIPRKLKKAQKKAAARQL